MHCHYAKPARTSCSCRRESARTYLYRPLRSSWPFFLVFFFLCASIHIGMHGRECNQLLSSIWNVFGGTSRVCKSLSRLQLQLHDRNQQPMDVCNWLWFLSSITQNFPFGCLSDNASIVAPCVSVIEQLKSQPIWRINGVHDKAILPHPHHHEARTRTTPPIIYRARLHHH